jgi:hypothetical protein
MAKILPFPKGTDLSIWLEDHVARPSRERESRLLWIRDIPHPDQDPKGVFDFCRPGRGGRSVPNPVRLLYQFVPMPMPEWFYPELNHLTPGNWFLLRIGPWPDGTFAGIPIRQFSLWQRPQEFCARCHARERNFIDEQSAEMTCSLCSGGLDFFAEGILHTKDASPRKLARSGRCLRCGFSRSAPIHNREAMKANPIWHEFASSAQATDKEGDHA